ncbi:MAG: DUF6492 family protein [Lachnospiraceae bacterium]|nr:DUF6492 family protein [Lachnospiraceae bacterium]
MEQFDTYIIITPRDFVRLQEQYPVLLRYIPEGKLIFTGCSELKALVDAACLGDRVSFLNENDLLPFDRVHETVNAHMSELLQGDPVPRAGVGWYYQQFLKFCLAGQCMDAYYLVWDGDTIPCRPLKMFSENGSPYFDNKNEYHEEYFRTMEKLLPGLKKLVRSSFISEHMLFHSESVKKLIRAIESNSALPGDRFWEKIIHAIDPARLHLSAFSEFETYGSFMALNDPMRYRIREWHSFRLGGEFFDPDTICERDYEWLGKDFDAISFEKHHSIKPGNGGLFDNPEYQKKLSARQMLQIAQEEAGGGYLENWDNTASGTDPLA